MLRLPRWKVIACTLAVLFGVLFSLPNVLPASALAALPGWLPHQKINLGLDLQGGAHLLFEVDTVQLKAARLTNLTEDVRSNLQDKHIPFSGLAAANGVVAVRITDPTQVDAALKALEPLGQTSATNTVGREVTLARGPDQQLVLTLSNQAMAQEAVLAVSQSIETIRRRVDAMGTREPTIIREGTNRIVVEAPGESDPERLKSVIGQTAHLTFQMVDDSVSAEDIQAKRVPPGSVLLPEDGPEGQLVVRRRALVSGEMLTSASQGFDQYGKASINFRFNGQGAHRFANATIENVGKRFAIVLDNKIISAPTIQTPITAGSGEITGNFTVDSANDLALLLRSGALPAPLKLIDQRTVSAGLGADSIQRGSTSLMIGAVAIFVFIIAAYGLFGVFAAIALVVNGLMMVAALSMTQATLTLPGIAGLVLTLAVAIDANVLIYERMRDESRAGRTLIASLEHGYSLAYPSIADANITSLIAALIMFEFGSGPVKGFAWTLSIGVMTSVFTAILVTQVLIGWWFRLTHPKKLPI